MAFSATWFLLQQEGLLAQACLCNGLTALRRANLGDKMGLFYSAFFELSIGLERTLKLVLILDHMAKNKLAPPPSKYIAGFRHDLIRLFKTTQTVCTSRGLKFLDEFQTNSLPIIILDFLNRFADTGGRYSNINKLTGHKHQVMADPIVQWGEIANRIMREHATPRERKRAELNGQMADIAFGNAAVSLISDLNQQPMDVPELHVRASELDIAAKYAIYALVTLIAALRDVISSLCGSAWLADSPGKSDVANVPDMKEFFQFAWPDRQYVWRKRMWP
jgi:hypothetical protein